MSLEESKKSSPGVKREPNGLPIEKAETNIIEHHGHGYHYGVYWIDIMWER